MTTAQLAAVRSWPGNLDRHGVHFLTAYSPASNPFGSRYVNSAHRATGVVVVCHGILAAETVHVERLRHHGRISR